MIESGLTALMKNKIKVEENSTALTLTLTTLRSRSHKDWKEISLTDRLPKYGLMAA